MSTASLHLPKGEKGEIFESHSTLLACQAKTPWPVCGTLPQLVISRRNELYPGCHLQSSEQVALHFALIFACLSK
jgi:hypothetical protein